MKISKKITNFATKSSNITIGYLVMICGFLHEIIYFVSKHCRDTASRVS